MYFSGHRQLASLGVGANVHVKVLYGGNEGARQEGRLSTRNVTRTRCR